MLKYIIICDAIVRIAYIVAVTVAAVYFNTPDILFFYALVLLMVHNYTGKNTGEEKEQNDRKRD